MIEIPMKKPPMRLLASCLLALAGLLPWHPAPAAESLDSCAGFIDAVPATITRQGTWCLRHDLSTAVASGAAITVAANNVAIDCNHFKLGGLAAGDGSTTVGIKATNRQNASVRHCAIRGFHTGIDLTGSGGGHLVEDNRIDQSLVYGIRVSGDHNRVHGNRVFDTGGVAVSSIYAIWGTADMIDNIVSGMTTTYAGSDPQLYGIFFFGNGTRAHGNRVRGQRVANTNAEATGVRAGGVRQSISGNHVAVVPAGEGWGLVGAGAGTTFCRDNHVAGYVFDGLRDCDDKGGNAIH